MSEGELILYSTEDGAPTIGLRAVDETVWLSQREIAELFDKDEELNRIVVMYLDYAEDQARRRRPVAMAEWADKLDAFLSFNERDVLTHAGRLRRDVAQKLAVERFEVFDAHRRAAEALAADEAGIAQLEEMEKAAKGRKKGDDNA